MDILQGGLLGVIQGLTEFLPVSSSGHLVLTRHLFGLVEPNLFFDTSVHVGTMLAVILVFRKDIADILRALFSAVAAVILKRPTTADQKNAAGLRFALYIVLGSIPTALIGLLIEATLADYLANRTLVAGMLIVTAFLLWMTRGRGQIGDDIIQFSKTKALLVGGVQGLAVLPGISRSGATIAVAMFLGADRQTAAKYSFLLSIPAISGAQLLSLANLTDPARMLDPAVLWGGLIAFVVGYAALRLLLKVVHQGHFYLFAPYCLAVGLTVLTLAGR